MTYTLVESHLMRIPSSKPLLIAAGILPLVLLGAFLVYRGLQRPHFDEALRLTLSKIATAEIYSARVDTETMVSNRLIRVTGLYKLDFTNKRFSSIATTTLILPPGEERVREHQFTLENIALGEHVYVRVETGSAFLKKSIPTTNGWQQFPVIAIPPQYQGIAVPGPILDNLSLFKQNGLYIGLIGDPIDEIVGGTTLRHYTLALSPAVESVGPGPLQALVHRISGSGHIDLWIDPLAAEMHTIRFENEGYVSTTTEIVLNPPILIESPRPATQE